MSSERTRVQKKPYTGARIVPLGAKPEPKPNQMPTIKRGIRLRTVRDEVWMVDEVYATRFSNAQQAWDVWVVLHRPETPGRIAVARMRLDDIDRSMRAGEIWEVL